MLAAGRDRGIAIVAALWASAILAVVVLSVLQLVRADARLGRGREDLAELGAVADAAVNITVLALWYGERAMTFIRENGARAALALVVVLVVGFLAYLWWTTRRSRTLEKLQ